jgi:hypothetical protein
MRLSYSLNPEPVIHDGIKRLIGLISAEALPELSHV